MKHVYLFLFLIFSVMSVSSLEAQAKRIKLYEHFTQASCGPCATQNPAFSAIYNVNAFSMAHVAYHTSWPGVDPMNAANAPEVAAAVGLYGVMGVPNMIVDGVNVGSPTNVSQVSVDQAGISPVRIKVTDTDDSAGLHTVVVSVLQLGDVPTGSYIIRSMVVEKEIVYANPPGSNGEKDFPNVFRKFLGNGFSGEAYIPTGIGETVTFTYTYNVNGTVWAEDQMYPLVYIQETASKAVLQAGFEGTLNVEGSNVETETFQKGDKTNGNDFDFTMANIGEIDEIVTVSLTGTWPSDWSAHVKVNGLEYGDGDQINLLANSVTSGSLHVTVGQLPGIGDFQAGIISGASNALQQFAYIVISGVTDLIIVSDNKPATGNPDLFQPYEDGLVAVNESARGRVGSTLVLKGFQANVLDEVDHIYYSIGWTFPAMTDEMASYFQDFMDTGGNLMIAGQDAGWDMASGDVNANGTAFTKSLFTDYFSANFKADGGTANTQIKAVATDAVYGTSLPSGIKQSYGSANYYPDEMDAIAPEGYGFMTYQNNKNCAVRANHGSFKAVVLGIGLEMVNLQSVATGIMATTHDWFHGKLTDTEFDQAIEALKMGQNYPNPANEFTYVRLSAPSKEEMTLTIFDMMGRPVLNDVFAAGVTEQRVDVSTLTQGVYTYQLSNGKSFGSARQLTIVR